MIQTINDWAPETRSLLRALIKAGFTLLYGNNGEYGFSYKSEAKFITDLTACDEARIKVKGPDGLTRWLYLVYGNEPGVLVSDYSIPAALVGTDLLDAVTEAHYEKWSERKQPTKVGEYRQIKRGYRFVELKGAKLAQARAKRLEYLRGELRAERISYGEISELQSLAEYIPADDVELREAAGLPEDGGTND